MKTNKVFFAVAAISLVCGSVNAMDEQRASVTRTMLAGLSIATVSCLASLVVDKESCNFPAAITGVFAGFSIATYDSMGLGAVPPVTVALSAMLLGGATALYTAETIRCVFSGYN